MQQFDFNKITLYQVKGKHVVHPIHLPQDSVEEENDVKEW
jgi:hypothetical protein